MKLLIIEDSDYKIDHIQGLVAEVLPNTQVFLARAFRSGIAQIMEIRPDILILDMTLPTFEARHGEGGGRTRPYGGREILRELVALRILPRVIVVTQFDRFGEGRRAVFRDQLMEELKAEFPELIVGGVYYNGADSKWRDSLKALLEIIKQ